MKINSILKITFAFASLAMISPALMAENDYGAAGCGLGSLVFSKEGKFQQVMAATTNGTFGSQTFGISSGTSNCEKGGKLGSLKVREFVASNRTQIETEAARGSGETLVALASIMNCSNESAVKESLRTHFEEVFTSGTNQQIGENAAASLNSDPKIQAACRI